MASRDFDIVVYGATGFTGRLVCAYLHSAYDGKVRWAMAGRNREKLERIRGALSLPAHTPLLDAAGDDDVALRQLAARTGAVISTVGPYQLHGSHIVAACAASGADYFDMSGEPVWMRDMLDLHEGAARQSGARVVFSCGFDSVPFDISVYTLQALCRERWGQPSRRIRCRVRGQQGGISGGTAATRAATEAAIAARPDIPKMLADPFLLVPGAPKAPQPNADDVRFEDAIGQWVTPFYMAFINTKHVHRTNHLLGDCYGADFRYDEFVVAGPEGDAGEQRAHEMAGFDPFDGKEDMQSGDGPSAEERAANFFDLVFIADGPDGKRLALRCHSQQDPGYEATAKMLVEAALCAKETPSKGGFWTPAALLGDALAPRLAKNADIYIDEENAAHAFSKKGS